MNPLTPTSTASSPDNVAEGIDPFDILRQHKGWSDADLDQLAKLDEALNQLNQDRAALDRERAEFNAERAAWNRERNAYCDSHNDILDRQEATETIRAEVDPFERLRKYMRGPGEQGPEGDTAHEEAAADESSDLAEDEQSLDIQDNRQDQAGETTAAATEDSDVSEQEVAEETTDEAAEPEQEEFVERRAVSRAPEVTAASDHEESIEDYMAQLLNRMRGGAPGAASAKPSQSAPPPKAESRPQPSPTQTAKPETPSAPVPLQSANTSTPVIIRQRPRAPKTVAETLNLSAMREVANQQSRLAIDKHQRMRDGQTALGRWSLAAISGLAGTLALSASREPLPLGAALIGFTAAAYWMFQGSVAAKRFFATTKTLRAATDGKPTDSAATPAVVAVEPATKA